MGFFFVVCEVCLGVGFLCLFWLQSLMLVCFHVDVFDDVVQPIRVFMGLLFHVHSVVYCCIVAC